MIRFSKISLFAIGFGILISSISVTEAKAQGPLTEILRRMDLNNKSLQSLQANVTMVKVNTQLGEKDTSIGTTSYLPKTAKHDKYVRIDWTKPVVEKVAVVGDSYELWRVRLNQVIVGKASQASNGAAAGGALGFMSMSRDQLKENYEVIHLGNETLSSGTVTFHLQLTPKGKTSYKSAELWVDSDGMPQQAKIIEANNDTTTVLLSNIKKNVTLQASLFKLEYDPKTVKK